MRITPILLAATSIAFSANVLAQFAAPTATDRTAAPTPSAGADPFVTNPNPSPATVAAEAGFDPFGATPPPLLGIVYETFSLSLADAASLIRSDATDPVLYQRILEMVKAETALQESLTSIRVRPGEQATSESIEEYIYPLGWEPAELPSTIGLQIVSHDQDGNVNAPPDVEKLNRAPHPDELTGIATPATATAFETRNVGVTLEVQATPSEDGKRFDVYLAPEHVTRNEPTVWGQGVSTLMTANIERQTLSTGTTVDLDVPRLLGTVNRPPVSKADPDSASRIWFAFVTVKRVK